MVQFETIDKLRKEIEIDANQTNSFEKRFPVRIILLNCFDDLVALIDDLEVNIVDLSERQKTDLFWYSPDNIANILNGIKESSLIFPLSEIYRFLGEAELKSAVNTILNHEDVFNENNYRLYIPLVSFHSKLSIDYWDSFYRAREGAKVWKYYRTEVLPVKVFKSSSNISSKLTTITNTREWLSFWKRKNSQPLISSCKSLNKRWDLFLPDECFEVGELNTEKDIITNIYGLDLNRDFSDKTRRFWIELLNYIESFDEIDSINLEKLICLRLNKNTVSKDKTELFREILIADSYFNKWLLLTYYIQLFPTSYLSIVDEGLLQYRDTNIYRGIYNAIFTVSKEDQNIAELIDERKNFIEKIPTSADEELNTIAKEFICKAKEFDFASDLTFLTNRTNPEKRLTLELLKDLSDSEYLQIVKNILPDIASYLNFDIVLENWYKNKKILQYLKQYNFAKAKDIGIIDEEEPFTLLNATPDNFYSWYINYENIDEPKEGKLVQIDALGVEWLPFIVDYITKKKSDFHLTFIDVKKVNLPSVTFINKLESSNFIREGSIDEYIHQKTAYYPFESLLEQIERVKKLIDTILVREDRVLYITGDHGVSNQCLKRYNRNGLKKFKNADHEGRCAEHEKALEENSDFIYKNGYCIALNHNSLGNLPRREVHGGATPEEVLVPFIKLERISGTIERSIVIENIPGNTQHVLLKIQPYPHIKPTCTIDSTERRVIEDNNAFKVNIQELSYGKQSLKVEIDEEVYSKDFEKKGAVIEEDLF